MLAWLLNLGFAAGGSPIPAGGLPARSGRMILETKRQGETVFRVFDFSSQLAPQETIMTQTVFASVYSGVDPSPALLLLRAASLVGASQVQQLLTGGVSGVVYELLCKVTTTFAQTVEQTGYLAVIPDLP